MTLCPRRGGWSKPEEGSGVESEGQKEGADVTTTYRDSEAGQRIARTVGAGNGEHTILD